MTSSTFTYSEIGLNGVFVLLQLNSNNRNSIRGVTVEFTIVEVVAIDEIHGNCKYKHSSI